MFQLGPVWFRIVLYGPVWPRMVTYRPAWSRIVPHSPALSRMVLHSPAWSLMAAYGPVWPHIYGLVCSRLVHNDPLLCMFVSHLVSYSPTWSLIAQWGSVWTCMTLYDLVWPYVVLYIPSQPHMALYNHLFFLDCKYCLIEINLFSYSQKIFKLNVIVIVTCGQSEKSLSQNKIKQSHLSAAKDSKLHKIG